MKPSKDTFRIFSLNGSLPYAQKVATHLGVELAKVQGWQFSDGEMFACSDENVRGQDCYLLIDPYTDPEFSVNDKLVQIWILILALRKASARTVTWVKRAPTYDRQDRKDKPRRVATTQMMGMILDALYLDRLITLDPHSKVATDNQIRRGNTDVLSARKLLADAIVPFIDNPDRLVIQQPDTGAAERTELMRQSLQKRLSEKFGERIKIPLTYFNKRHEEEQETVTGDTIVGDVHGKDVLLVDDIISTGGTIRANRHAIETNGGRLRWVAATHGYFTTKIDKKSGRHISAAEHFEGVEHIFVTDSMGLPLPWRVDPEKAPHLFRPLLSEFVQRLHVVDTSKFIAQALWQTDNNGSINQLLVD